MTELLCGREWYLKHRYDHTEQEIASLSIAVSCNGKKLPPVRQDRRDQGLVKDLVKSYRDKVVCDEYIMLVGLSPS